MHAMIHFTTVKSNPTWNSKNLRYSEETRSYSFDMSSFTTTTGILVVLIECIPSYIVSIASCMSRPLRILIPGMSMKNSQNLGLALGLDWHSDLRCNPSPSLPMDGLSSLIVVSFPNHVAIIL